MDLPKRSNASVTGISAAEALSSTLTNFANVVSVPVENDFGIDFMCELIKSNSPTGIPFYVQCKGTDKTIQDKTSFSIQIKVSTINYWLINNAPVLLILVDKERQKFYWTYPYNQLKDRLKEIQNQKKVNINVSMENHFSFGEKKIPQLISQIIKDFDHEEILMTFKEIEYGVSLKIGNIYELYREFKELKSKEKLSLRRAKKNHLQYVRKVREQFSHFFITSDIRIWREFSNQLCFFLFKRTKSGNCYYIADVIILFDNVGTVNHIIELTNREWLDTEGDVNERIEDIVRYLNKIY